MLKYFSYFAQKTGFDSSYNLSPMETICRTCQNLFSGKNKKNISNLSSAELAQRVVEVKSAKQNCNDTHEISCLIFSEKYKIKNKINKNVICCSCD